jgi:hypothetical protein
MLNKCLRFGPVAGPLFAALCVVEAEGKLRHMPRTRIFQHRRLDCYFSVSSQAYSAFLKAVYCSRRMLCPAPLMYTHLNGALDFQSLAAFSAVSLDTMPVSEMMSKVGHSILVTISS